MDPGGKTRGVAFWPGGTEGDLVSGSDEREPKILHLIRQSRSLPPSARVTTTGDVELKFAMKMREADIRHARLVINHKRGPCPGELGCDQLLPTILPPGASLTVYWPGGRSRTYLGKDDRT